MAVRRVAARQANVVARADVRALGLSDGHVRTRVAGGRWQRLHPGVYAVGAAPLDARGRLRAAVAAAGAGALVSHRAAVVLWGLDGIDRAPPEVTVPFTHGPVPAGVIVHRTRRPPPPAALDGIAVTSVERTLLDAAGCLPASVVEKALESALRRNLTSAVRLGELLAVQGGRGVRGARRLRAMLGAREMGGAAGSAAEVELLRHLRAAGVPPPVRQHRVALTGGRVATVDLAWPARRKAVEVDGLDAHATAGALDHDHERQNALLEAGWELRRYAARRVRRQPAAVVESVARFLRA